MRKITASTTAAILLSLSSTSGAARDMLPTVETNLLRTTLIVANIERAVAWYALLGLVEEQTLGGERNPDSTFPLASRSGHFSLTILAARDGGGGRLGLLEFSTPAPPQLRPASSSVGVGSTVLVLETNDARSIFAALERADARLVTTEPMRLERLSSAGEPMVGYVFHVFDPDANLVEVMQPPRESR
jgi:catechol 2,3-dioxygenase-like lactoylglutathione lyase family enzyme